MTNRREFIVQLSLASTALAASGQALAADPALSETDAQAAALGYKADATKVDKTKFEKYTAGQACSSCALFQSGKGATGGCTLFPGKQVSSKGWCSAYAKKA